MKQQTIDLIKSMTEQGFLVIVDPEKLKGEGAVMVEVMNWNENNNGVEISSAHDEKINAEIAKLAGFKKEEPKPEIDLLKCDGRRFRAKIKKIVCDGRISVEDGRVFLCQNSLNGNAAKDKKGFKWSWSVENGTYDCLLEDDVTNFELLPEPRVIFTNCVGEVFTEEDVDNKMTVWYADIIPGDKTINTYSSNIALFDSKEFKSGGRLTDIFRSKK